MASPVLDYTHMTPRQSITIEKPQTATAKVYGTGIFSWEIRNPSAPKSMLRILLYGSSNCKSSTQPMTSIEAILFRLRGGDVQLSWLFHMIWLHFRLFYWGFLVGCTKFNWQLKYNIFICPVQTDENPCCHNNMNIICVWAFTLKRFDVMARKSIIGFLRVLRIKGDERINADYVVQNFDWDLKFVLLLTK